MQPALYNVCVLLYMVIREGVNILKKTALKILSLLAVAALAFTVVHFAVLGNNSPTDTAFTFAVEDGKAILTGSEDALSGAVILPAEIAGYTVTGIGDDAFKNCTDVTAFFLPDTITTIGSYAFENCTSMAQAILPEGLTSIGEGAFWKCSSLVSVTVPASVRTIGSCAFYKCDSLESLVVLGTQTPVRGIFNVALDIGQTISIMHPNGAAAAIDPIVTTVYCYNQSVAYYDAIADSFSALTLLDNCTLTSYTVRYTDTADADVAPLSTMNIQPAGIKVAAVAVPVDAFELSYPDPAIETIELTEDSIENVITFVYGVRTYTVTFDTNGGEAKEALVYAMSDSAALGDASRTGYTFVGWKVSATAADDHYNWGEVDTAYSAVDTVAGKYGDVTLIAVWEGNSITVTYDAQGGTPAESSKVVTFGDTYGELAGAAREGYTFDGWYSAADGGSLIESTTTVTNTQDHSIYARWTINRYNITVTTDGNGTARADLTKNVPYGTTVTLTATPNTGYSFSAWESDEVTVAADGTFVVPDKAVSVKAVFSLNSHTLTVAADSASMGALTSVPENGSAVDYGATVTLTATPNPGYHFTGYTATPADIEITDNSFTMPDSEVSVTANFTANTGTISFKTIIGRISTEESEMSIVYGQASDNLPTLSNSNWTFLGWAEADNSTAAQALTAASWAGATAIPVDAINDWLASEDGRAITLYAVWSKEVQATFIDVSGTQQQTRYVTETIYNGASTPALNAPAQGEYTGWTAEGWTLNTSATATTTDTFTAGRTYYGKYSRVISADYANGGHGDVPDTAPAAQTQYLNAGTFDTRTSVTFDLEAMANVTGYTFTGWLCGETEYTDSATLTPDDTITNYTFTGVWSTNSHSLTVTTGDTTMGTVTAVPASGSTVDYGTNVTLTATPKPGYSFSGWESDDVTVAADGTFAMPDKDVSVLAIFAADNYTITYDTDGGAEKAALTYKTTDEKTLGSAEKAGYTFLGWSVKTPAASGDYNWGAAETTYGAEQSVLGKYGNVTLKALWMANNITVTYNAQGGNIVAPSKTVTVGSVYGQLQNATRSGYTFLGWFTASESGSKIESDTVVTATEDHTIYAHWSINHYDVTVTTDGHGTAAADPAADIAYGATVTLTAEPATGYSFRAWESSDVTIGADGTFVMPAKNVTVNAVFAPITYTIAFDANSGENTMDPIDAVYDADVVLPANAFDKTGFEFLGWATAADAETVEFTDEDTVKNLTATAGETVTLYALWKDIKVELIAKEGSTTVIDEERGFIYGLEFDVTEDMLNDEFLDILGNGHLEYEYYEEGSIGTGTIVRLINDNTNETAATYTIVIFGDINGDGMLTSADITAIRNINARLTVYDEDSPFRFAADVTHDDDVGPSDVTAIRMVNARLSTIEQTF